MLAVALNPMTGIEKRNFAKTEMTGDGRFSSGEMRLTKLGTQKTIKNALMSSYRVCFLFEFKFIRNKNGKLYVKKC